MTLPHPLRNLTDLANRYRPALFSPVEWRFHLLAMLVLTPIGAYLIMGASYFRNPTTFVVGTVVNEFIFWYTVVLFTLTVRWVIRQFPELEQAGVRFVVMLLLVGLIMGATAVLDLYLFSLVPSTGVRFSWDALVPIWIFGCVASPLFCLALTIFYTYTQWQERQTENEQLKRQAIQQQYDALKSQVNPHFLFNSLNSVSSLIGEDNAQAERFVDQLSKVYRYMLQAGKHDLVSVEMELDFLTIYAELLGVRYQGSLRIEQHVDADQFCRQLPPLTMQTLVDNAIKHNSMTVNRPLVISVSTHTNYLRVANTLQRKNLRVETAIHSLSTLLAKYRLLGQAEPIVEEDTTQFSVLIPLFEAEC